MEEVGIYMLDVILRIRVTRWPTMIKPLSLFRLEIGSSDHPDNDKPTGLGLEKVMRVIV